MTNQVSVLSESEGRCKLEFEAKLLGFPNEDDRIKLCETCLRQAIADNLVVFSSGIPRERQPRPTNRNYMAAEMAHLSNPESDWPYGHRFQRQANSTSKCSCGFALQPIDASDLQSQLAALREENERLKDKVQKWKRKYERIDIND